MACYVCEQIADDVCCQTCAEYIIDECVHGTCQAMDILSSGSIDGHKISDNIIKLMEE